jgi:hypothetical protein
MAVHVYLFLLVGCLLFFLARLGRLDWLHLQPSHSRGGAKRSRLHRLRHRPAAQTIACMTFILRDRDCVSTS